MSGPFKLKYKNSAFPFKGDNDDTIIQPDDINLPDVSKEVLDIYNKLDWEDKEQIPIEKFQKAYFEQQRRQKEHEVKQQNIDRSA